MSEVSTALDARTHAAQLAHALAAAGYTPMRAATLTAHARAKVAAAACVRDASSASWRTAVEMLARSARTRAACPDCRAVGAPRLRPFGHQGSCG